MKEDEPRWVRDVQGEDTVTRTRMMAAEKSIISMSSSASSSWYLDSAQGLVHARLALYHQPVAPTPRASLMNYVVNV